VAWDLGENKHATSVLDDNNDSVACGAETGNKRASEPAEGCGTVSRYGRLIDDAGLTI